MIEKLTTKESDESHAVENDIEIGLTEDEKAFNFQETQLRERWDKFVSPIINKGHNPEQANDDLSWFTQKFQKTKKEMLGMNPGGWTNMLIDLASDAELSNKIDQWRENKITEFIKQTPLEEDREMIINHAINQVDGLDEQPDEQNKINLRSLFLEKLLNNTTEHFSQPEEARDENQELIISSFWSEIVDRFVDMRVETCKKRFQELLPMINKNKQDTLQGLNREGEASPSQEGDKRVKDVMIWIGDEYLESGSGWNNLGSYNANLEQPRISIAGNISLNETKFNEVLGHELIHVASGHKNAPTDNISKESQEQHVVSKQQIGLSGVTSNNWLDEAITEMQNGKAKDIPSNQLLYSTERHVLQKLMENINMDENDLLRWYYFEGDDSSIKAELQSKYPDFFDNLSFINKKTNGGKALEKLSKKDLEEIIEFSKGNNKKQE